MSSSSAWDLRSTERVNNCSWGRELGPHLADDRAGRGQRWFLLVEHRLKRAAVPARVQAGRHHAQELLGSVQASPEEVVLPGLAGEEGGEVVGAHPHQLLGRQQLRVAVERADADDLDVAELADPAQLDNREDQRVPDREAEVSDEEELLEFAP